MEMEGRIQEDMGAERFEGAGPHSAVVLRGAESREFHRTLGRWEEGAGMVLRMSLLPSKLGSLVEEARALAQLMEASTESDALGQLKPGSGRRGELDGWNSGGSRLSGHVGWGVLRFAVPKLPGDPGGSRALAKAMGELRSRLEAEGGSLTISSAPRLLMEEVGAWGVHGPELGLMRGLKAEFDPAGVLSPGRFGIPQDV